MGATEGMCEVVGVQRYKDSVWYKECAVWSDGGRKIVGVECGSTGYTIQHRQGGRLSCPT